jgi:hypothetical protein
MTIKYLITAPEHVGAECPTDAMESTAAREMRLEALEDRLRELAPGRERAAIELEMARVLVDLERGAEAWTHARSAFARFAVTERWEQAADACNVLFLADQPGSLSALGQGIWLAVTYPIDPELTVALLQHVIDETPEDSDGAAVAATAAAYVVDLRAEGKQRDDLTFFVNQMLGSVARRHGKVESQADFDAWFQRLELEDPKHFLPRLRNIIDVLVQDDWWIDTEALRAKLPVN